MRTVILSMAIGLWTGTAAMAADCHVAPGCCDQAAGCCEEAHGCCGSCGAQKVCKVVCEMKKVKKNVWVVECEEFCAPLPSCGGCCKADCGCCESDCCESSCCGDACCNDPCAPLRTRCLVPPKCGKVRCRKKLVSKEVTCEVPVYKCVVVCCAGCCEKGEGESGSEGKRDARPDEASAGVAPLPPVLRASHLKVMPKRP